MAQIPFISLPIPLPKVLLSATGVYSRCRFIGFCGGNQIVDWFDGFHQGQFLAKSLWHSYVNHWNVAVFLYPYQLDGIHALLFDAQTGGVYIGELERVQEFLRSQPYVESEADAPDIEPMVNPLETVISTGKAELAYQQALINSLNAYSVSAQLLSKLSNQSEAS